MSDRDLRAELLACEIWRDIPGYKGRYRVSDQGRVLSLRYPSKPRTLRPSRMTNGYLRVCLGGKGVSVHRLVLLAFVGPPPTAHECGHLNNDRADNRLSNLRWMTQRENREQKILEGRQPCGERNGRSRLMLTDVEAIRDAVESGEKIADVARRFGVYQSVISGIRTGKTWRGQGNYRVIPRSRRRRRSTHCPSGHVYDQGNTYVRSDGDWDCRACQRDRAKAAYHRRQANV